MAGFSATQRILRAMLRKSYDTSEMSNSHGFSRLSSMLDAIQSGEHGYVDGRIEGLSHMYFTLYPYDPSDRVRSLSARAASETSKSGPCRKGSTKHSCRVVMTASFCFKLLPLFT